jgi:hypothetical protein
MEGMGDEHDSNDRQPRSALTVWLIVAVVLLPVLYVASIGPCHGLLVRGYFSDYQRAAEGFYSPLTVVGRRCPPIGGALYRYEKLWATRILPSPRTIQGNMTTIPTVDEPLIYSGGSRAVPEPDLFTQDE